MPRFWSIQPGWLRALASAVREFGQRLGARGGTVGVNRRRVRRIFHAKTNAAKMKQATMNPNAAAAAPFWMRWFVS